MRALSGARCTDVRLYTLWIKIGTNQRALGEHSHYWTRLRFLLCFFFLLLFSGLKVGEDNSKNNFLLSQSKHIFWVLKKTVSGSFEYPISGSFEHPKYMFRLLDIKIIAVIPKLFSYLDPYCISANHIRRRWKSSSAITGSPQTVLDITASLTSGRLGTMFWKETSHQLWSSSRISTISTRYVAVMSRLVCSQTPLQLSATGFNSGDIHIINPPPLIHVIFSLHSFIMGAQWLSGRVLVSRPLVQASLGCVLEQLRHINFSLVLVQPRKTRPKITERLLTGT